MTTPHHVDWEAIPWQTLRPGVERKAFTGEGATLALHRLWPGHQVNPHSHPYEQIAYIIDGSADFVIGNEKLHLGPGGVVVIPPDVLHYATVVGDRPVINLDVFSPARPEIV